MNPLRSLRRGAPGMDALACLVVATLVSIGFGIQTTVALAARHPSPGLVLHQVVYVAIGVVIAVACAVVPREGLLRVARPLYVACVALLVLGLAQRGGVRGVDRWVHLGRLVVQPSEFLKPALVLAFAAWWQTHGARPPTRRALATLVAGGAVPIALVFAQPDLGTAVLLLALGVTLLVLVPLRPVQWLALAGGLAALGGLAARFGVHAYQRARIEAFFAGVHDPHGADYQRCQSLRALAAGGFSGAPGGTGWADGAHALPAAQSDLPMVVWGHVHGWLGVAVLLVAYFALVTWALRLARHTRDRFGVALAVGVAAMVFWQVTMNVGMTLGLLPIVGVTLPYCSAGGSSLVAFLAAAGVLFNVSIHDAPGLAAAHARGASIPPTPEHDAA